MSGIWADWLAVAAGGAAGASLRHAVNLTIGSAAASRWGVPAMSATLIANVAGCAALGAAAAWIASRPVTAAPPRFDAWLMIRVGLLGSLTTFSTFIAEIMAVGRQGALGVAAGWVLAHLVLGAAAMAVAAWWVASRGIA